MTMKDARELVRSGRILSRANAFFLANLVPVIDVAGLTEGDADDDYYVEVPTNRLAEVERQLTTVKMAALDRFNAHVSMFPIILAVKPTVTALAPEESRTAL